MATQPIIDRSVMLNMISLVDFCYRSGIEDAYHISDEGLALEFLDKVSNPGVYGFLNDRGVTMGWQEWTLRLMAQARMTSWNGAMTRYFSMMGRLGQNYLGTFIPVSGLFYAKGIKDYIDAPQASDMALFHAKNRVFWTPQGLKNVNSRRYVDEIQLCCFDLKRRDEEVWATETAYDAKKKGALRPFHYDRFIYAVGLALTSNKD